MGRGLRGFAEPARRRLLGTAPRSTKDYATHLPVLIAIAQHFHIEQVLEFGCGNFSTPIFLNQRVFRHLRRLESFDNDKAWINRLNEQVGSDSRYASHLVEGSMSVAIREIPIEQFDLVFVDDSTSAEERVRTIRELSDRNPTRSLIVIHDYEVADYRSASMNFEHRHNFKAFTPQTGVVWNGNAVNDESIRGLESRVKRFAKTLEPDDVEGWLNVLSR